MACVLFYCFALSCGLLKTPHLWLNIIFLKTKVKKKHRLDSYDPGNTAFRDKPIYIFMRGLIFFSRSNQLQSKPYIFLSTCSEFSLTSMLISKSTLRIAFHSLDFSLHHFNPTVVFRSKVTDLRFLPEIM